MRGIDLGSEAARRVLARAWGGDPPDRAEAADDAEIVDRHARVWWSHLVEPGDSDAGTLIGRFGAVEALGLVFAGAVEAMGDAGVDDPRRALERWTPRIDRTQVESSLRTAGARGVRLLVPGDRDWPGGLSDLGPHAPLCLWLRGDVAALASPVPSVAIVGARAATAYGEHVTNELAHELAAEGITVVSGAAYGIDGAAHRAALAAGGRTIAFMAGGADRAYPAGHSSLIDRIVAGGASVSEVPPGSAPTKWRFLQRNRLIAALADATVVVEAGWRSGSLNTAAHAAALGRPVGAVPGPVTSVTSAGTHRLIRDYAAVCVTNAAEVRELLGLSGDGAVVAMDARPVTDDLTRLRDALSTRAWRGPDDLARRSGLPRAEVEAMLGRLDLEGGVERGVGGWRLASRADR